MDKDAVSKMGMTTADVTAMIAAWSANVAAWRQAIYEAGLFEWFMVYGGQQTAPGWSQTQPNSTCLSFMRKNCGAESPSQNGTMFFGYSRYQHSQAWGNTSIPGQSYGSLLSPTQECVTSRAPPKIYGCGWRLGPGKYYENVGESQSVLIIINPIISIRTRRQTSAPQRARD
jgi:hypothetical protein